MKTSVLSAAVLAAVASTAGATGFEWPANFDDFTEWTPDTAYTSDIAKDSQIKMTTYGASNYPNLVEAADKTVTNNGAILVQGLRDKTNGHKRVVGMMAHGTTGKAVNAGTVYVDTALNDTSWTQPYDISKGMATYDGGVIENAASGVIYVKAGAGMADQRDGTNKTAQIINNGKIYADSSKSIGLNYGAFAESTVENNGEIVATNGATAVKVSEAWPSSSGDNAPASTSGKTFLNTGLISADGGYAVNANDAEDFTLKLLGEHSNVDGKVFLASTATIDATEVSDEFELSASRLKNLKLTNSDLGFTGDQSNGTTIEALTISDDNTLTVKGDRTLTVTTLNTVKDDTKDSLNFVFDRFADEGEKNLTIVTNNAEDTSVTYLAEAVDDHTADEVLDRMRSSVDFGKKSDGTAADGFATALGTNFTVYTDTKGNSRVDGSDLTKSTNDLAAMTLVAWRNEVTTLNDRMSTLRTSPAATGVWARYNGGEYEYDARSVKNEFHTIEVGADHNIGNGPWTIGASLAYTKGDGDFEQGETDSDSYSAALYALWSHESGSFVDMVMKTGRIESDYDFYNLHGGATDSGKLKQTGFIVGIETGHRFALPMNTFVEPQIQLTYSRLSSVHETTAARTIDLEASDSLIGRVGVMAGIACPNNKGAAYVRVSALRDFRGDIDGTYSSVTGGGAYTLSQELDDDWFEFAVGANYNVTDNFVTFVDVQRSTGAEIELNWRANVGAKLFF